jgi:hypothetical protein
VPKQRVDGIDDDGGRTARTAPLNRSRSGRQADGVAAGQALWAYGFTSVQALLRDGDLMSRLVALRVNTRAPDRISPSTWEVIRQSADVREQLPSELSLLAWPRFAENVVSWATGIPTNPISRRCG